LFLRNLLLPLWPIELIAIHVSGSNKKLGDRLAHTSVYRVSKEPKNKLLVICAISAVIIFVAITFFGMFFIARNNPIVGVSREFLENEPRIEELVGDIERFGVLSWSIQTSPAGGQGEVIMSVHGTNGRIMVNVHLERLPSQNWEVISFTYR